jgi:hypothetical protein
MKISKINIKTLKPLRDLVAYKWLKVDKFKADSPIIIPDSIHEGGGEGRLGHRYTCEVLAIGPEVKSLKIGDKFLLHEYDKVETAVPWNEEDVMFAKEEAISILLNKDADALVVPAKRITQKMADEYEDY